MATSSHHSSHISRNDIRENTIETIGKWRIIRLLGWGQSGEVYEVREIGGQRRTGALKAWCGIHLKVTAKEFRQEIAFVKDNNVPDAMPTFLASGKAAGSPFYVMELLKNVPDELDEKSLVRIGCGLIGAVESLHHSKWLHCDIKPSNLGLKHHQVRLIDFGSVCRFGVVATHRIRVGSRRYMAPEVLTDGKVSVLSEIFSIGMTLHDLCRADDQHLFEEFFRRATATDPTARPQTLPELRTLLLSAAARHRQQVAAESRLPKFKAVAKAVSNSILKGWLWFVIIMALVFLFRWIHVWYRRQADIVDGSELKAARECFRRGDYSNEVRHLHRAANAESQHGRQCYLILSKRYRDGMGVPKDVDKSREFLLRSKSQPNGR